MTSTLISRDTLMSSLLAKSAQPVATPRKVHDAARAATRSVRQAREWASPHHDANLQLAERILDEVSMYASLRSDSDVPAEQARERLVQFLDGLLAA